MLAVFAGGFDREATAAVWDVAPAEARDGLSLLSERSMLLFNAAKQRYRLHDLMRDLALGAAEPLSEEEKCRLEEARDRHSAHHQRLLAEANTLFVQGGEGIAASLARFDQERANIETGWRWLRGQAADDKAMARRCSDYVAGGDSVLPLRQHPHERIEWLEAALAAARRLHDRRGEGDALGNLGTAYDNLGEYHQAIKYHEQYLTIAREIGNRRSESTNLGNLGNVYFRLGEYRRAIEYYEQSLAIAREIGYRQNEACALGNLGNVHHELGEYHHAIKCHEQASVISRETGDRQSEGTDLFNAARGLYAVGEHAEAIARMQAAVEIYAAIGSPFADRARNLLSRYLLEDEPVVNRIGK